MATAQCYGGPANGVHFELARLPKILRVTRDRRKFDALDLLEDEPTAEEEVFVYRMIGSPSFVCRSKDPLTASYEPVPVFGVNADESVREREGWQRLARRLAADLSDEPSPATFERMKALVTTAEEEDDGDHDRPGRGRR